MACLVARHFVNGVVNGVKTQLLCHLGKLKLACGRAVLGSNADSEVLFGRGGNALAEQLRELGGVLCLLKGGFLPIQRDLGVTLASGGAGHRKVHTDLGALALEVGAQTLYDLGRNGCVLGNADHVLGSPGHLGINDLLKLVAACLANGALFGHVLGFNDLTADLALPFLGHLDLNDLLELVAACLAQGALFRHVLGLNDLTANLASPLFHLSDLLYV